MNKKLFNIINYAYRNVPMYKNHALKKGFDINKFKDDEDITSIPCVCKSDYLLSNYKCFSEELDKSENNVLKFHTAGSTGKCMSIYRTIEESNLSLFNLWFYRKKWYNINTSDKVCIFVSFKEHLDEVENGILYAHSNNSLYIYRNNICDSNLMDVYRLIQKFEPKWMILQPSIAVVLCEFIIQNSLKKIDGLTYIELTGEILAKYSKALISNVFECKVANQYGCEEVNSIAYECPNGHLHCMKNNVYVEILDEYENVLPANCQGDIVLTSLINKFMPFVRYRIGDFGKFVENIDCEYNYAGQIIELANARSSDYIVFENGTKISSYVFFEVVEMINNCLLDSIIQFQIEQLSYTKFDVRLVINTKIFKESTASFDNLSKFFLSLLPNQFFQNCDFEFYFYDKIFPDKNLGKLKYFSSQVDY